MAEVAHVRGEIMKRLRKILVLPGLCLFSVFTIFSQAPLQITPSTIVSDLIDRKKQNPRITDQQLAFYANELLAVKGYNYNFEISDLFNKFSEKDDFPDGLKEYVITFPFEFTLKVKRKRTYQITAKKNLQNQCYDESFPAFPVNQVTQKQATVIVEGNPVILDIPKEFDSLSVYLVDAKTRKKVLQKWVLPDNYGISENNFVGFSSDGKSLYLAVADSYVIDYDNPLEVKELALEIASDGKLRFVPKSTVKKKFKLSFVSLQEPILDGDIMLKITIAGKIHYLVAPDTSC